MLIQDAFVEQFYQIVKTEHILILVNEDVDALCASMILCHGFSCDDIGYTLCPVDSVKSIEKAIEDYYRQSKYIVMINCGGYFSLLEIPLPSDITIFIIDSRRPFHLDNIFNNGTIRILARSNEVTTWNLPEIKEIYRDDDDSDDEDEDNEHGDRSAAIERRIVKREEFQRWRSNRDKIMFDYYGSTWYAEPSSVFMLELIHKIGKSNAQTVWCASVGLCSQLADGLISSFNYLELCRNHMKDFIVKYGRKNKDSRTSQGEEVLKITFEKELLLPLYTRWSLQESLTHDIGFCCQHGLWRQKGNKKYKHKLAEMEMVLEDCKQPFDSLQTERKLEYFKKLDETLDEKFICFKSHCGYGQSISSIDFARILALKLELQLPKTTLTGIDRFHDATNLMQSFFQRASYSELLKQSIEQYKIGLKAVRGMIFGLLDQQIKNTRNNFCVYELDSCIDDVYLTSRHLLNYYLYFLHSGYVSSVSEKGRKSRVVKPFFIVVSSNLSDENNKYWTITGNMPLIELARDLNRKSTIPSIFKQICDELKIEMIYKVLDPNIIHLRNEDKTKFFDYLDISLAK